MARTVREDEWEEGSLVPEDFDGDVAVLRTEGGAAVMLPRSLRNLRGEALEVAEEIQHSRVQIHELQERVAELVGVAREIGLSWNAIGFLVGTTGDAARRRWSE